MFLLADILPIFLFLAGVALLTSILLRRTYKYFGKNRRRRNDQPIDAQPRPKDKWTGVHADATARIERQKVELHEMQREVTATIDSKMIILRELINKSQAQIDRMEELLAELEESEPRMTETER